MRSAMCTDHDLYTEGVLDTLIDDQRYQSEIIGRVEV